MLWWGWNFYWTWMVAVNVGTFWLFRLDKARAAAGRGQTRIPEVILLVMIGSGGVIGGLAGMLARPRHKVRKPHFWLVVGASALLHIYLFLGPLST